MNITSGTALKTALTKTKAMKVETAGTDPYITGVSDKLNDTTDTIKIGPVMEILGSRSSKTLKKGYYHKSLKAAV